MPRSKNNGLTIKQKAFIKNLTDTSKNLTQEQAAILAGYSPKSASSISSELMGKTKIIKALDRKGITDDFLIDGIKTNIVEGIGVKATADTATKNIELALKLRGHLIKDDTTTNNTQNIYVNELIQLSDNDLEARLNALHEAVASKDITPLDTK
jgi:hypothetical protein